MAKAGGGRGRAGTSSKCSEKEKLTSLVVMILSPLLSTHTTDESQSVEVNPKLFDE
jgi:hypothetical protein